MKDRLIPLAMALLLLSLSGEQARARSLIVLADGSDFLGEIEGGDYRIVADAGGELVVPRAALHRLEADEGGRVTITLKDGTTFRGRLETELHVVDGLVTRVLTSREVSAVDFDIFVVVESASSIQEVCPIRLGLPLPLLLEGKPTKYREGLTTTVRCDEEYVSSLEIKLRKNVLQDRVVKGQTPKKGFELGASPTIFIPRGDDRSVHIALTLVQAGREIAYVSRLFEGDEGELNDYPPLKLWYAPESIAGSGPIPILRIQMVSADSKRESEKGTAFWWFTFSL